VARPRTEILEGLRWLAGHSAVRTLVVVILTFNVTWGAAWSVLVLWAQERLHAGEFEYGLLKADTFAAISPKGCVGWSATPRCEPWPW